MGIATHKNFNPESFFKVKGKNERREE